MSRSEADLPERGDHVDTLHGHALPDPWRWLEDSEASEVRDLDAAEALRFRQATGSLPQREWLFERLQSLWRVDDETPPSPVLDGDRLFVRTRRADQDEWVVQVQEGEGPRRVVLDPNTWDEDETLTGFWPSPDGRLAVFARDAAGREDARLYVLDVDSGRILDDTTAGWRLGSVQWRRDGSGFWFAGRPAPGSVAEGDEQFYHRVWWHPLGGSADDDEVVICDDEVKEHFHGVVASPCGRYLVLGRYRFHGNALWLLDLEGDPEPVLVTDDLTHVHDATVLDGRLVVRTEWGADRCRLMVAPVETPQREHWRELVPEGEGVLEDVDGLGGRLYLTWRERGATRVSVHALDGAWLQDVPWPTLGTGAVWGHWSRDTVWASFQSYGTPRSTWRYHVEGNRLELYRASPVPFDAHDLVVELDAFRSRDGTEVTAFVVRRADLEPTGDVPVLLTGYGGFNLAMRPLFSAVYALWAEQGGMVVVPHLRGGGEYGRAWHEAGRLDRKQNVFDDFIAAAEHLVEAGWTRPEHIAISGGSNGGLLVSAVVAQRPDLFGAVRCAVPLADMLRFHELGIGRIWTEEYGDPDIAEQFAVLRAYSPVHNLRDGVAYPPTLVTGSTNDARTHPAHARKFWAALVHADVDHGGVRPLLLHIQQSSGHHGAVTIDRRADQSARDFGFLASHVGLSTPSSTGS